MTLGALKTKIYKYLQRADGSFVDGDLDLVIEALETARLDAERMYTWNAQRKQAQLVVQPEGALLSEAVLFDSEDTVRIRTIEAAWVYKDGTEAYPLAIATKKDYSVRAKQVMRKGVFQRYPGLADTGPAYEYTGARKLVINGDSVQIAPTTTEEVTVVFDCQLWMDTYREQDDEYEDWMLIEGHDYLFWSALIELNHITKSFVPRQEGNISPPERQRDRALQTMREADTFKLSSAIQWSSRQ